MWGKLPEFIVLGAQKSASTFLQELLRAHPDIYMPQGETPFFESPDYESSFLSQLANEFCGSPHQLFGIKRPSYIGKPEVPARICRDLPNARLIAVLRHPVDRAISAIAHNMAMGFIPVISFDRIVELLLAENEQVVKKYPRAREILEFGCYAKYLRKYDYFQQKGQLLVMLHDDFIHDPIKCFEQACLFLGVDSSFRPSEDSICKNTGTYDYRVLWLTALRNKCRYRYDESRTRMNYKKQSVFDVFICRLLDRVIRRLKWCAKKSNRNVVSEAVRQKLLNHYTSDIHDLRCYLDLDIEEWLES